MKWRIPEWELTDTLGISPVRAPFINGDCTAVSEGGWFCTRLAGHGGRHAAGCSNGEVVAVWL